MRKLLSLALLCACSFLAPNLASAATVYVAATAGVVSGGSLCNTHTAVAQGSITWTAGNTYILCGTFTASAGAGGYFTVGASGTSGNPITIELDSNTVIQAPYWGTNGAVNFNNQSYVTLNCLSQGTIKTTQNGAGLTYQQPTYSVGGEYPLINMGTGSNTTVENCTGLGPNYMHVAPLLVTGASGNGTTATLTLASSCPYAVGNTVWIQAVVPSGYNNTSGATVTACSGTSLSYANPTTGTYSSGGFVTDENGFGADGIVANLSGSLSVSNITIAGNVIHDVHWAISGGVTASQTLSNVTVTDNTLSNIEHGIAWFDNNDGLSTWSGTNTFSGNVIHDWANWDDQIAGDSGLNQNHHDGIHIGAQYGASGQQSQFSGFQIDGNYMYGNPGIGMTTMLYLFGDCVVGAQGCFTSPQVYNNVFVNGSPSCVGNPANGLFLNWTTGTSILNNVFQGCSSTSGTPGVDEYTTQTATGSTYYNNIFSNLSIGIYQPYGGPGKIAASDYNDFYNLSTVGTATTQACPGPSQYCTTLANWQSCTSGGCPASHDAHSVTGNPTLNASSSPPYQLSGTGSAAYRTGSNLTSTCTADPALCTGAEGNTRPGSGAWDIGPDYFNGGSTVSTPTLSPAAPATFSTPTAVTITSLTSGATLIYTTDGSTPATSSGCTPSGTGTAVANGSSYTVSSTITLEAIGCLSGSANSGVVSGVYTYNTGTLTTPSCTPGTGTSYNNPLVSCTGSGGANLCYALNATPTAPTPGTCGSGSVTYSTPISITATGTNLQVLATKVGYTNSSVASYTYTLTVQTPDCSLAGGAYVGTQSLTCLSTTTGAAIYYAIGSTPTCSSTLLSGPLYIVATETFNAIACLANYNNSSVRSIPYTITPQTACGPPAYPCSSTSTAPVGTLTSPFSTSTLFNSVAYSPLNPTQNPITRLFDQNVVQYGTSTNMATALGSGDLTLSGSPNDNFASLTGKYFMIRQAGGPTWVFQTSVNSNGAMQNVTNGGENPSLAVTSEAITFSRLSENVYYYMNGNLLEQATINSGTPMTSTVTSNSTFPINVNNCPGTSGVSGNPTWYSSFTVSSGDGVFAFATEYGGGGQGYSHLVFAVSPTLGCSTLDLAPNGTSSTFGNWYAYCIGSCSGAAPSGTESTCFDSQVSTGSGIHDAFATHDGLIINAEGGCWNGTTTENGAYWQIGTGNVQSTTSVPQGAGHASMGYVRQSFSNDPTPNNRLISSLTLANLSNYTNLTPPPVYGAGGTGGYHEAQPTDLNTSDLNYIIYATGCSGPSPAPGNYGYLCAPYATPNAYQNELFAMSPATNSAPLVRLATTYNSATSPYEGCEALIGGAFFSQDGNYAFFLSDSLTNLGTDSNSNPLCSVFAVRLDGGTSVTTNPPIWPNGALLGAIPRKADPLYPHLAGGTH